MITPEVLKEQLTAALEFYNEHGVRIPAESHPDYDDALWRATDDIDESVKLAEDSMVDKPRWFRSAETKARDFYASLGFLQLRDICLLDEHDETLSAFSLTGSTVAVTNHLDPFIVARFAKVAEIHEAGGSEQVEAVITHELAHDTAPPVQRFAVHIGDDAPEIAISSGFLKVKRSGELRGAFIEEGFAHFMSGWARRVQQPDYNMKVVHIDDVKNADVPAHLQINSLVSAGPDGYAIELLACCLEQRNIMSANDFVATLLDSRRAQSRLLALRTIARSIDLLEPGLYSWLNKLQPSQTDWNIGFERIHELALEVSKSSETYS